MPNNPTKKKSLSGSRFEILSRNSHPPTVSENHSMPKAKGGTTKTGSSAAPTPQDSQVEALKRVLDEALATGNLPTKESSHSNKSQQKEPLKDIINTGSGTKTQKGDGKY
ncbi:hypothetical protein LINPERHAP1_LOCUS29272 [Linum perenne]